MNHPMPDLEAQIDKLIREAETPEQAFIRMGIRYFKPKEYTDAGANIKTVSHALILGLDRLRAALKTPIKLVYNGVNSGKHIAKEHPAGQAADVIIGDGLTADIPKIIHEATVIGLGGVGCYWNDKAYSWHFDVRQRITHWIATKTLLGGWRYRNMIIDPRTMKPCGE